MILALDIASVTGAAVGRPGTRPDSWTVDLGRADDVRFANALRMTDRLIREYSPDLVAIEAPVGGPKTSHLLVGLVACVRGACTARGVRVEAFNIASIRKHFVGGHVTSAAYGHLPAAARKGAARKAGKMAVMNRCRSLGWPVTNDNEADACALWDYAASRQSHAHAVMTAGGLSL